MFLLVRRRVARNAYWPRLEVLEDRSLPSVAANIAADGVFIRYLDGQLFEHTSAGFQRIDVNTAQVSAGVDASGNPTAFILYKNGAVYEWSATGGFMQVDINAVSIAASQSTADTVFIIYNNHQLWEHTETSAVAGFRFIDVNVAKVSAGFTGTSEPAAFIVYANSFLFEWALISGFHFIDVNVSTVSAVPRDPNPPGSPLGPLGADRVYIVYVSGQLFEHASGGFRSIDVNVTDVSAGVGHPVGPFMPRAPAAFILYQDGEVAEWGDPGTSTPVLLDIDAVGLSASPQQSDTAFIVKKNTQLFEYNPFAPTAYNLIDGAVDV
jgi:hypothetical protein